MKNELTGRRIVDVETGEILEGAIVLPNTEGYQIIKKETVSQRSEYFKQKQRKEAFDELTEGFTFSYIETVSKLHSDERFTDDEKTRIMFLGTYVSYAEKGSYLVHSNGRFIYKSGLKKVLEISKDSKFYSFYNKLVEAEIITEEETIDKEIKLNWNEQYHFRGAIKKGKKGNDTEALVKTFDTQIRELYKSHTAKQLYIVFLLLPFIHYGTNIICRYPNKPFTECEPMELKEIAEGIGIERSNDLKRKLLKINLYEQPVFKLETTSKGTHVTVNPFVIWRQNRIPEESLMVSFYDTARRIAEKKGIAIKIDDLIKKPILTHTQG